MHAQRYCIFTILALLLLTACTSETDVAETPAGALQLRMTTLSNATRAYWRDENTLGGAPAVFHWETTSPVNAVVFRAAENRVLSWTGGGYYSPCTVTPMANDDRKADITSTQNVEGAIVGTHVYFVAHGQDIRVSESSAEAHFPFPDHYSLTVANSLEELKDYTYMYASSQVESITQSSLVATPVQFDAAVACLRLIVENASRFSYKIRRITMSTDNGTKLFPNELIWRPTTTGISVAPPQSKDNFRTQMVTELNSPGADGTIGGLDMPAKTIDPETLVETPAKQTFYMIIPPISDWSTEQNLKFEIEYSTGLTVITSPFSLLPVSKIPNGKFEAGKIYNLNFKELVLDVNNVTVDDWIDNKITIGQITVKPSDITMNVGETMDVTINAGHTELDKLSATPANSAYTTTFEVDNGKVVLRIQGYTAGTYEITVNDQKTNSMATINVTIN